VEEAFIYGSRALGSHREGSDIDLVLKGDSLSFQDLLTLKWKLDDLLLPWHIDLSLYSRISNPELIDHIQREGKVFYRKNPEPKA
jgi:predicted nucleotidyltransferase